LNILHVIRDLSRSTGGPVTALAGFAEAQAALGHRVTVLATARGGDRIAPHGAILRLAPGFGSWSFSPALGAMAARLTQEADVVHGHMAWDYPVWAAARQARRFGKPFVLSPCGHLDKWSMSQKALKKKIYLAAMGDAVHGAAALHFTTEGEREASREATGDRFSVVIPLGTPEEAYANLPQAGAFSARFPALAGKRLVLFLGRLHSKKQPDVAIDAFHRVAAMDARLYLVLAGPAAPDYEAVLAARAQALGLAERVTFTGLLQGEAVREAYAAAEIFVLPSFQENFGLAVAEAMAAACPVVVSDRLDLAAEIGAAGAGLVCAPQAEAIAAALARLVASEDERRRMGENGRALVLRRFTWPPIAAAMIETYERLIRKNGA
jgi:glycosyltransferase involved in cell wall biosynthesis